MPTPMHVYNEIAARYGVDSTDEEAVDHFFEVTLQGFTLPEQQAIFDELLSRDGETEGDLKERIAIR